MVRLSENRDWHKIESESQTRFGFRMPTVAVAILFPVWKSYGQYKMVFPAALLYKPFDFWTGNQMIGPFSKAILSELSFAIPIFGSEISWIYSRPFY
jgi:hypothetical protein